MATPEDVARALHTLAEKTARRIDEEPTGVTPGYSATLGGAVLPNGKVRYVSGGGGGAVYEMSSNANRTGGSLTRINFDSAIVANGNVTTGASWNFAPPADGLYRFSASTRIVPSSAFAAGETLYLQLWPDAGGTGIIDLDWMEVMATEGSARSLVILAGTVERLCVTTDAVNIRVGNGTGNTVSQRGASDQNYSTRIAIARLS
jgi:hypothetical protein